MNKNEASASATSSHASKKQKTEANNACFHCAKKCPLKETLCPNGCQVIRMLWTSSQQHNYGKKFLKCMNCEKEVLEI